MVCVWNNDYFIIGFLPTLDNSRYLEGWKYLEKKTFSIEDYSNKSYF